MRFTADPGPLAELDWAPGEIGDGADQRRDVWSVEMKGGQTPLVQHGSERVRAVRMVREGRLGFAASRTASWRQLQAQAADAAVAGPETKLDEPVLAAGAISPGVPAFDPAMAPRMSLVARELYSRLEGLADDFRPAVSVAYHQLDTRLMNSSGGKAAWTQGYFALSAGGRRVDGTDFHAIMETRVGMDALTQAGELGNAVAERFAWGRRIQHLAGGRLPIVFLPPVVMSVLMPVLARLSGPALIAGNSPWEAQVGQRVLSPSLTILSDATLPGGPRTAPFDDEGTPTGRWPLIEAGELRHFVLDRDSARRLGHAPRGMGYRPAPNALPAALPANLAIEPGELGLAEWGRRFPRLLVLNGWIGARPTNPLRGDIAGNASELYLMDQGVITGRIKNAVISLNAFEALSQQLAAVGLDAQWLAQGMMQPAPGHVPPLLIDGVDVSMRR
ncbi:MAG: metallopeptidase TldD-related protein [Thermaerobacter sp.]|nr:metallopeptidase TldD-related protein [Thermaerobacter sp.]